MWHGHRAKPRSDLGGKVLPSSRARCYPNAGHKSRDLSKGSKCRKCASLPQPLPAPRPTRLLQLCSLWEPPAEKSAVWNSGRHRLSEDAWLSQARYRWLLGLVESGKPTQGKPPVKKFRIQGWLLFDCAQGVREIHFWVPCTLGSFQKTHAIEKRHHLLLVVFRGNPPATGVPPPLCGEAAE